MIDITSAESRFAASSKLDDVRVEDSKKMFTTVRPRSVGQLLHLALERALEAACGREQPLDVVARQVGDRDQVPARRRVGGGSRSSRTRWISRHRRLLGDEQDAVDLVDLDELHLHALAARGGQVLADVVGADRQLAVAAVGDDGELDAGGPAVVEQRLDRGADRPARVEDVVDEDAGAALDREVEPGLADERLRVERRLAAADVDVVAVEGDVERAEVDLDRRRTPGSGGGGAARAGRRACGCRRARPTSRSGLRLDDLVRDAVRGCAGAPRRRRSSRAARSLGSCQSRSPFRPHWTGLKDGAATD